MSRGEMLLAYTTTIKNNQPVSKTKNTEAKEIKYRFTR